MGNSSLMSVGELGMVKVHVSQTRQSFSFPSADGSQRGNEWGTDSRPRDPMTCGRIPTVASGPWSAAYEGYADVLGNSLVREFAPPPWVTTWLGQSHLTSLSPAQIQSCVNWLAPDGIRSFRRRSRAYAGTTISLVGQKGTKPAETGLLPMIRVLASGEGRKSSYTE